MPQLSRPALSIVLPVYNEELVIPELVTRLHAFLASVGESWEVVFVNDGSSDRSLEMLDAECAKEPRFKLISFSRNFGHQIAITAGVDHAEGEAVVVMDADLQDPPEVVTEMLAKHRAGYDVVYGVRRKREGETVFKLATAAAFYRIMRSLAGIQVPLDAGDFRLMSRRVVLALRGLRETNRFVRGMVVWVGFKQTAVHYDRPARFAGETHFPFRRMLRFAVDAILSFSLLPLRVATALGILSGFLAMVVAAWTFYIKLTSDRVVPGWATIMGAISLAASAQLLMTGILGEYLGRIYEEVKRRPLYLVERTRNVDAEPESKPRDV